jgi:DMSO/TMAO reductase YedYZ molybdopterin-dependent catalytic subunit
MNYMKYFLCILLASLLTGCIGQQPGNGTEANPEYQESGGGPVEITPLEDFFVVDLGIKPEIDVTQWRLEVTGLVDTPLSLTYDDILSFPAVTQVTYLYCVTGLDATGEWTGVPVKDILEKAGYSDDAVSIIFYAADDYSSSITIEKALEEDTILAYGMNGVTLPEGHGYPLRLVVPGKVGYKWVKWVVRMEVVDYDYEGYWESRGYSNVGDIPENMRGPDQNSPR